MGLVSVEETDTIKQIFYLLFNHSVILTSILRFFIKVFFVKQWFITLIFAYHGRHYYIGIGNRKMIAYQDHNNCGLFCWKKDITVLITLFLQVTVPNEWATLSTVCSLDLILEEICHRDDPVNIPGHVSVQAGVAAASEEIVTSHSTDNIKLPLTLCRCWWCPPGCTCSCESTSRVRRSPPGKIEGL